jgi:hypothetical protein
MNHFRKYILPAIAIIAALWLFRKCSNVPSLRNIFAEKPVIIDETPILIKEVKSIGQLITYSAIDEVVADSVIVNKAAVIGKTLNRFSPIPVFPYWEKKLVLIGKGKVLAGVNLALLHDSSIAITNDTVRVTLPKAEILDAILNPSDFETFVEKGNWTSGEVLLVKQQAKRKIIDRANKNKIVDKAALKARAIIESFILNLGYKHVLVV